MEARGRRLVHPSVAAGFDRALYQAHVWGNQPTDIPVPGDYDGDGKTDIHVWRLADRLWFMLDSATAS